MAEKKYIERETLLERIDDIWDCADMVFEPNDHCCHDGDCEGCKWAETKNAIRKIIADFPAADVRPVVLCRDCKWTKTDGMDEQAIYCMQWDRWEVPQDGFCWLGEKREES